MIVMRSLREFHIGAALVEPQPAERNGAFDADSELLTMDTTNKRSAQMNVF
jgi:hypothetical protein